MKATLQLILALAAILAFSSNIALASGDHSSGHAKPVTSPAAAPQTDASKGKEMVDAEIRKIDLDAKKITLKHERITSLDMPGMTMVFQALDPAVAEKLKTLKVGDKVRFNPAQQAGAFVVTDIEKK